MFSNLEVKFRRKLRHTARFYPVDLHCHSAIFSPCFGRKDGVSQEDIDATPEQIAIAACKRGLFILVVTDHHRCENAKEIAEAADRIKSEGKSLYPNNNLIVLPGMEIAVEENARLVHVLAIFPENTHPYQIEPILANTGIETNPALRAPNSRVSTQRLATIIQRIKDQGGLAILAHVNSDNGYRKEMKEIEMTDQQILQHIHAFSINAIEISKPEDLQHFFYNDTQFPCIIGSDAHYIREIGGKEFITRVKMTIPCFKHLERALQDPETRIRFQLPQVAGIKEIHGITLEGGFLDGQTFGFTSNLNCLIGGRGTGKSSLIEAIRYLFEYEAPQQRQRDVESLRNEVLAGCTATLLFEDQFGENYVLQRFYGDPHTKILALDGSPRNDIDLSFSQNLRLSIYGWSEIEGIAQDTTQQLDLIDSYIKEIPELKKAEEAALGKLKANARDIKTALDTIEFEAGQVGNLRELRQELKNLGEEETEEEKQKAKIDNESVLLETIEARLDAMREQLENIDLPDELNGIVDEIQEAKIQDKLLFMNIFDDISTIVQAAKKDNAPLQITKADFLSKLDQLLGQINQKTEKLAPEHKIINEGFEKLLDKLEQPEAKAIARRRKQLREEIRRREQAKARQKEAEKELKELSKHREGILKDVQECREKLYRARLTHIKDITGNLPKGKAKVDISLKVIKQGNRDFFITMLNEKLVNLPRRWRERAYPFIISSYFTPIEFTEILHTKNIEKLKIAGFKLEEANDILTHFENKHEDLMEFEACDCTDLPHILFNVEGEKRPIENLSPGQRCTALLPIILLETDTPLIIDQPEDNLDNQFIFDLVVNTLRSLKERRQIIVATHNPNIPVSGDAENILVFKPEGSKGKLERNGSIDYKPIIEDVKSIMEGGEHAFIVRARKYGLSKSS